MHIGWQRLTPRVNIVWRFSYAIHIEPRIGLYDRRRRISVGEHVRDIVHGDARPLEDRRSAEHARRAGHDAACFGQLAEP